MYCLESAAGAAQPVVHTEVTHPVPPQYQKQAAVEACK